MTAICEVNKVKVDEEYNDKDNVRRTSRGAGVDTGGGGGGGAAAAAANDDDNDNGRRWDKNMAELRAYKVQRGNCNVPPGSAWWAGLAVWMAEQRVHYDLYEWGRPSPLTPEDRAAARIGPHGESVGGTTQ